MKAKPNLSRQMTERAEEMMYDYTVRACETNNAFFLLALNQEFNFGRKRLKKLIAKYNEISLMYKDNIRDGFTDEEIREMLKKAVAEIGIEPGMIFTEKKERSFVKVKAEKRKFEKNNVPTYSEASEVAEKLQLMKSLLNNQKTG